MLSMSDMPRIGCQACAEGGIKQSSIDMLSGMQMAQSLHHMPTRTAWRIRAGLIDATRSAQCSKQVMVRDCTWSHWSTRCVALPASRATTVSMVTKDWCLSMAFDTSHLSTYPAGPRVFVHRSCTSSRPYRQESYQHGKTTCGRCLSSCTGAIATAT